MGQAGMERAWVGARKNGSSFTWLSGKPVLNLPDLNIEYYHSRNLMSQGNSYFLVLQTRKVPAEIAACISRWDRSTNPNVKIEMKKGEMKTAALRDLVPFGGPKVFQDSTGSSGSCTRRPEFLF